MAAVDTSARDGESMVKRHHDKLQAEKEAAGIAKLQSSLPKVAKPVLAYALQDSQLDAEKALLVLRQFQSETFDELNDIQQRRKHLRSYGSNGRRHSKRSASASPGSGDDSDSSEGRRHRHEKSRKHKHKKSSKHGSDKRKDRHKKHKKEKRSKRSRHSPPPHEDDGGPGTHGRPLEFGSFGVLREADYTSKRPEFAAWASEIKRIDIESLPRGDERDLFREFLEDFNTCTLPHRKFYDLAAYARTHGAAAVAASGGRGGEAGVDDEMQRRNELQAERRAREDAAARELMSRMVLSEQQISELKQREMMRLRAQDAYKTGDMGTANRLMKRLRPVDEGGGDRNEGDDF